MKKLKRVIIKEEFVALTGDCVGAIILNQLLIYSDANDNNVTSIKISDLVQDTMLNVTLPRIIKRINLLIDNGYIKDKTSIQNQMDSEFQYRVNFDKICEDLELQDYVLQDYKLGGKSLYVKVKEKKTSCRKIIDLYNTICVSYPKCTIMNKPLRKLINSRLSEFTEEDVESVFKLAEESSFLKGKNTYEWKADLTWMMRKNNFIKILNGAYQKDSFQKKKDTKEDNEIEKKFSKIDLNNFKRR